MSFIFSFLAAISISHQGPPPRVEMKIEKRGSIVIELFEKDAPKTVAHFLDLVDRKFYDGILFHRVVPKFVAQAGDPESRKVSAAEVAKKSDGHGGTTGLGDGGSGKTIPFEENTLKHEKGTMGMALDGKRTATGDSQFFINLVDNHRLNGDYCVFGKVLKGMDIVLKIELGDKIVSVRRIKTRRVDP